MTILKLRNDRKLKFLVEVQDAPTHCLVVRSDGSFTRARVKWSDSDDVNKVVFYDKNDKVDKYILFAFVDNE